MKYRIENRRYTGSKAKLVNWIMGLIKENCSGKKFVDIFSGTGVVAAAAMESFDEIIVNDFLYSNYVIYQAFFDNGKYDIHKLEKIADEYNKLDPQSLNENYFSTNFGSKYFDKNVAKIIGFIREDIENRKKSLTEKEYNILLASLIYSVDKIANTVGHYDAYIKKEPVSKKLVFGLIEPIKNKKVSIYRTDSNLLARSINADIVYIDPPYNSRQYSRFYHILETLTKWDSPELFGVAQKPFPENTSDYCKTSAPDVFKDLIENLKCKYIVVSYNNTYDSKSSSSKNKIKLEEIKEILNQRGKTDIYKKNYKFFNSGKTNFSNHQEWLFITKTHDN